MFMNKVYNRNYHQSDGQYAIPLPFREGDLKLRNNKKLADYQLQNLKSNFDKDKRYNKDYVKFMNEMLMKGHTEKIFPEEESGW